MKKMGKKLISGVLIGTMSVMMIGCGSTIEEQADDITVKVSTEADKEEATESVKLVIEQESFNTAFVLEIGESRKLNIDTDYKGELKFVSGDETVATIDEDGKITAVRNGIVTMTVIAGDIERHTNIIIKAPVAMAVEVSDEEDSSEQNQEDAGQKNEITNSTGNNSNNAKPVSVTTGNQSANNNSAGGNSGINSGSNATSGTVENTSITPSNPTIQPEPEPVAPSVPTTEATTAYNPADYYLDWYYIADQVNARLKAEYPNAVVGTGTYEWNGNTYEAGWFAGDYMDGVDWTHWTNETMIDNIHSSIKLHLTLTNCPNETSSAMGMVITSIEVHEDGSRTAYFTCYY